MGRVKKRIAKYLFILGLIFTFSFGPQVIDEAAAQCPMCRMSAESNLKAGGTAGRGLNTGILYMLAMPYLLVGTIGFIWWRNSLNVDQEQSDWQGYRYD